MSQILVSLHGKQVGLDSDQYLTSPKGAKFPELWTGPSGSELNSMAVTSLSTGGTLTAGGLTTLASSAGQNPTYHLPAPLVGVEKKLFSTGASTGQIVSSTGSGVNIGSTTSAAQKATFTGLGQTLTLVGLSTSLWGVVANVGSVALSS